MMEILLLQDIQGIGKKDDLLLVGDGYALNHLLPQAKAIIATPTVRRRYGERIRARAEERERERMTQTALAAVAHGKEVVFERKVTKTGKLYAAITEKNISEALRAQHNIDVAENKIIVKEPIKATGTFDVAMKVADTEQPLKVTVKVQK